ncbi:glycosyltransferase family 39 protein [Rhodanobacter sp. 7MK24]|uniref:glycosyltransferase family 39 protein n=1 Tax=Rhodanobacter sp. 7MK24 TaxID=2775922 RepID=UPI0017866247|nr:glycosyltransferase family 39 protein [Rhodanobacter sp. 7MK24]MBD8880555.1 glycosyltransferase family 39 protein [Rhodanobacter sp. 7MK24]
MVGASWSRGDWTWLVLLSLLALAARCIRLGHQPFWLDEVFTYQRIRLDTATLIADSFANRHMPNYFLLLRSLMPAQPDFAALRLPSALFGALSVGVVFAIGRRAAGRFAGCMAALLMALAPTQVQYGQEARSYALLLLLVAIALWGLIGLAQQPVRAALGWRRPDNLWLEWAAWFAGTIGALDLLGDAMPWLLASNGTLFCIWRHLRVTHPPALAHGFLRNWLWIQALVLACCLPFYVAICVASNARMLDVFDWVPALSWRGLWVAAGSIYLMRPAEVVQFGLMPAGAAVLSPCVVVLCGLGLFRLRGRMEGRVLGLAFAVLPLLLLAVSLVKPMLVPRYLLWSALAFFVLAGVGAAALPQRWRPIIAVALPLLCLLNLWPVYRVEAKPRWDRTAAMLATVARPGDTIYVDDPNAPAMLSTLQPRSQPPLASKALVTGRLDLAVARWRQGSRVWAVNGRSALGQRESLAGFEAKLAALGHPQQTTALGREITVLEFAPPPAG